MTNSVKQQSRRLAKKLRRKRKLAKISKTTHHSRKNRDQIQRKHSTTNTLNLALSHHSEGHLTDAEKLYQEVLDIEPNQPVALHFLGVIAHQKGNNLLAVRLISKALSTTPDSPYLDYAEANNNLGVAFYGLKRFEDAINSYKLAISINPVYALAHNNLGNTLRELERFDEALVSYKEALTLEPNFPEARHMVDSLSGRTSKLPPQKYVETLFDGHAENFDASISQLEYRIPFQIKELITKLNISGEKFEKTIDLGCGSGLAGDQLRDISEHLTGIDLSKNMLSIAKKLKAYDVLILGDIVKLLEKTKEKYDLFVALDVLIYIGDLSKLFNAVRTSCSDNALFIFSVETKQDGEYSLLSSGRYAHSDTYVSNIASDNFRLLESRKINLRKEKGRWIHGKLFVFQAS
ncbi:MAG: hypothetical protein CFH06_01412 [Alphaproteobacteria bacterium MarineAlpha3_Bin5]|nr:MAG: hypothetical protein CFH06_01412 [Alphaproteobacteria bacterium MarineAlpha3_Bin5]